MSSGPCQHLTLDKWRKVNLFNISVIFSRKPIGFEELLNQMVEALDIIIDRRPKGRLRKMES